MPRMSRRQPTRIMKCSLPTLACRFPICHCLLYSVRILLTSMNLPTFVPRHYSGMCPRLEELVSNICTRRVMASLRLRELEEIWEMAVRTIRLMSLNHGKDASSSTSILHRSLICPVPVVWALPKVVWPTWCSSTPTLWRQSRCSGQVTRAGCLPCSDTRWNESTPSSTTCRMRLGSAPTVQKPRDGPSSSTLIALDLVDMTG
mmetsp:Transcript_17388/g.49780  ORF Transcript_17388/g.49780 Transcript_17388/m.49780 type:complete len:203 (-) Transcript_17388:461-1069(-)